MNRNSEDYAASVSRELARLESLSPSRCPLCGLRSRHSHRHVRRDQMSPLKSLLRPSPQPDP